MNTLRFPSFSKIPGARTLLLALALAGVVPASAWAQAPETERMAQRTAPPEVHTILSVENHNWLDVHVYLVRDGSVTSLGFMSGPGQQDFELPPRATVPGADVQILVAPVGSRASYLSPVAYIDPGDQVNLVVENNLGLSSLSVFPTS